MSITLFVLGAVATAMGAVLLYGSLRRSEGWDSGWEQSIAAISGAGWLAVGALFLGAAAASGGIRTALLIAGAAAGIATAACRWVILDRWETRQGRQSGES
jgi:hypothetical protein